MSLITRDFSGRHHRSSSRAKRRAQHTRRPRFEMLEARRLLATWYVDGVGGDGLLSDGDDDLNSGTSVNAPFLTLTKANSMVGPGDTVKIRGGTYDDQQIKPGMSGTPIEKITYTNGTVVIHSTRSLVYD